MYYLLSPLINAVIPPITAPNPLGKGLIDYRSILFAATYWVRQKMIIALKQRTAELAKTLSLEVPMLGTAHEDEAQCLGDLLEAPDTSVHEEQQAEVATLLQFLSQEERGMSNRGIRSALKRNTALRIFRSHTQR